MICDLAAAGTTMLVVSHAMGFSARLSTRVVLLDHGVVVQAALFGARRNPGCAASCRPISTASPARDA